LAYNIIKKVKLFSITADKSIKAKSGLFSRKVRFLYIIFQEKEKEG